MLDLPDIPGLDQEDVGTLLNTRNYPQYVEYVRMLAKGECAFCGELDTELNAVITENRCWRAWHNPYAHKGTKFHIIVASIRHITHVADILPVESVARDQLIGQLCRRFELDGGSLITRFGNPLLNASSIRHLHVNLEVPDGTQTLQATLGKSKEKIAAKLLIVKVFEKMRLMASSEKMSTEERFAKLNSEEQALVTGRLKTK